MVFADTVREKKAKLDALRARIRPGALDMLDTVHRIDITYTSNALEGNTLTGEETALVIERGITVSGKPLKDHLEAVDHAHALDWVTEAGSPPLTPVREIDIRAVHQFVVARSMPDIAGRYTDTARYVNTAMGIHRFPSFGDVPAMMAALIKWLNTVGNDPDVGFEAHRRLVAIHPFNDGNGRTARLLMNLILIRGGYPPIAIRPEDRPLYISALEDGQAGKPDDRFRGLMYKRLNQALDTYINAASESLRQPATFE
ncbi:Fic family protein [Rhizobium sp. CFBP 8762]|uniref:Fic family protein n=1 Tax=Rhizobium sp. CFBP 8762 TaxID=2775279 RepID=UPI001782EA0C|nr:Fic family protein [Rhizobium sp. CFBP 8762]MBD8555155.1 Fic family protein [Rhizobium sp. CFBP 8762]